MILNLASAHGVEAPSAADFYVPTLPGLDQDPNHHPVHIYAGHLLADPSSSVATPTKQVLPHAYFVLLKARRTADKERLIIWFNGGPGCSSFDGLMMEVGPWRMDGKGGLKRVEGGWDEYAHVLYLDQPPGTGFSYTSTDNYLHELDQMAAHVNAFLINFYKVFPELQTVDTYLAGESFAGQYIPYIADAILKTTLLSMPLKGLAIGNGWIDGRHQYPAYYDFALKSGIIKEGSQVEKQAREALEVCKQSLSQPRDFIPVNFDDCESVMGSVSSGLIQTVNGKKMCLNVYDVRLSDEYPACGMNWPPDLAGVTDYLRRKDVITALHATDKAEAWTECHSGVFGNFNCKKSPASVTLLPSLLDKVPIMLFAGDQDFICNYVGIEAIIANLEWKGSIGMGDAPTLSWTVNGTQAGTWRTARNLTYVKVHGASHMVGFDLPTIAHDMMLRFMDVDYTLDHTVGLPAKIPSVVGDNVRGGFVPPSSSTAAPASGSTDVSEQDKARWEAYYNAGSAALIFVLIALGIGIFFYLRSRRNKRKQGVSLSTREEDEERIPLSTSQVHGANGSTVRLGDDGDDHRRRRKGKGKEQEQVAGEPIFDVGDDDSEDDDSDHDRRGH
ncbi:hypothetical protein M407DRAFT_13851 [Tulasnella calospora MUT 4182]|uniref:Pheromone-processing carboxypeptidase KEX1 n=1 Tax=Tulasnella calospora MUT 4182 TaxID=1051891 RepID=A0A0C3LFZ0_9AGAM|nr:hypothetical protein M407DRAFT_13851 [Tulasnella calospora MUT 4182]